MTHRCQNKFNGIPESFVSVTFLCLFEKISVFIRVNFCIQFEVGKKVFFCCMAGKLHNYMGWHALQKLQRTKGSSTSMRRN